MLRGFGTYASRHHLALLALLVAMGGTSYAAVSLPARSVGTAQLKNKAVTFAKVQPATRKKLRGQTGAAGPRGARGVPGERGTTGLAGQAGTTGQDVTTVYGSAQLQVTTATTSYTLVPGLTQSITVPAAAKVFVSTDGGAQSTATAATFSVFDLALFVDGQVITTAGQRRIVLVNSSTAGQVIGNWSIANSFALSAGAHVIQLRAVSVDPTAATVNVSSASAPQLQGQLTVAVLKQ